METKIGTINGNSNTVAMGMMESAIENALQNAELKTFKNDTFGNVRVAEVDGEPWFCAVDVTKALGYSNGKDAVIRHCKSTGVVKHDLGVQTNIKADGTPVIQQITYSFINERNLYSLIMHSKLDSAEKFQDWVYEEVLPSIRKHGAYMTGETIEKALNDPDFLIQLATKLKEERAVRRALENKVEQDRPKVEYFDALVDRGLLTNFRDTAKELHQNPKEFVNWLLDRGFVYRDSKKDLKPYSTATGSGLFEIKEWKRGEKTGTQTLVTPKGRETFRLLLNNSEVR